MSTEGDGHYKQGKLGDDALVRRCCTKQQHLAVPCDSAKLTSEDQLGLLEPRVPLIRHLLASLDGV